MKRLKLGKLHVNKQIDDFQHFPRKYTLTHSDLTGDLYLTVAREYDKKQISRWYT